jgi:hypothetical protein
VLYNPLMSCILPVFCISLRCAVYPSDVWYITLVCSIRLRCSVYSSGVFYSSRGCCIPFRLAVYPSGIWHILPSHRPLASHSNNPTKLAPIQISNMNDLYMRKMEGYAV